MANHIKRRTRKAGKRRTRHRGGNVLQSIKNSASGLFGKAKRGVSRLFGKGQQAVGRVGSIASGAAQVVKRDASSAVGSVERLGSNAMQRVSGAVQSVRNLNGGRKKTRKNKKKLMKKSGGAPQIWNNASLIGGGPQVYKASDSFNPLPATEWSAAHHL